MKAPEILARCAEETDADRRGAQVLLALARQLRPDADLPELVVWVAKLTPQGAVLDPTMVADVARTMGLVI